MSPSAPQPWTPYGLEAYRVELLRRRGRLLAIAVVLGVLFFLAILATTLRQQDDIDAFGGRGGQVEIALPGDKPRAKPTTLSVAPGRTTVLDRPIQPEVRPPRPDTGTTLPPKGGLNWMLLLTNFGPLVGGALWAWGLGRRRFLSGLEEVNLGVYKGALPLEMHSAKLKKFVFTRRRAHAHLFGKGRLDWFPAAPAVVLGRGTR